MKTRRQNWRFGLSAVLPVFAAMLAWFPSGASAQTSNIVSAPVGYVRIVVPGNSQVLASMPFNAFNPDINTVIHSQLTGATNQTVADVLLQWDTAAQSYTNAYKAANTGNPSYDGYWFSSFTNWTLSDMQFGSGQAFWIQSRQSAAQTVYLCGNVVLDSSRSTILGQGLNLAGYPFSTAAQITNTALCTGEAFAGTNAIAADMIQVWDVPSQSYIGYGFSASDFLWHYTTNWSGSAAADYFGLGQGFWYSRLPAYAYDWTETRPYANLFPNNTNPPMVTAMTVNTNADELTLTISADGAPGETLEVYYKNQVGNELFSSLNWQIAETNIPVNGQTSVTWTDSGSADRGKIDTVYGRYYLVGRGDIASDADGIPDARKMFVYGTNPLSSASGANGTPDGWEVQHGFYPAGIPVAGICGWWRLNEANGTVAYDSSPNGNNGAVSGAVYTNGYFGNGLSFDGSGNDQVSITNGTTYKPAAFTVAAIVNFTNSFGNAVSGGAPDGYMVILGQQNNSGGYAYAFYKTSHDALAFEVSSSSTTCKVETADGFAVTGRWYHLTGTYDGTNASFYVEGESIGTVACSVPLVYDSGNGLLLGHGGLNVDGYLAGELDDVFVLTGAISATQVSTFDQNIEQYLNGVNPILAESSGGSNSSTNSNSTTNSSNSSTNTTTSGSAGTGIEGISDSWEIQYSSPIVLPVNDLMGYWMLDETNGTIAYDSSTNGNNGVINGAVPVPGLTEATTAQSFDGVSDSIPITNSAAYKSACFTISAYANFSSFYGNTVANGGHDGDMVLLAQKSAVGGNAYAIYKTARQSLVLEISSSSATSRVETADGFVVTGQWYSVIGMYDGSQLSMYINGKLAGKTATTLQISYDSGSGLVFGAPANGVSGGWFNGMLQDVRVYSVPVITQQTFGIGEWLVYSMLNSDGLLNGQIRSVSAGGGTGGSSNVMEVASGDAGLSNIEEYEAGLDVFDPSLNHEGILDWYKGIGIETAPLNPQFNGTTTDVVVVNGSATNATLGTWQVQGTQVLCNSMRGYVEYLLTTHTNDMFQLMVVATHTNQPVSCSPVEPVGQSPLMLYVDGEYLGTRTLAAPNGIYGSVEIFTPYLTNGTHTVRIFWDNVHSHVSLMIQTVRFQSIGGPDANGDGVKDWIEDLLDKNNTIQNPAASNSVVSPVCLEGTVQYLDRMAVTANGCSFPVMNGAGSRWYSNVGLSPTGTTAIAFSIENGAFNRITNMTWTALNLFNSGVMSIRVNDSLKLTAYPQGATTGSMTISIAGLTNYSGSIDQPMIYQFTTPGLYTVTGTYSFGSTTNTSSINITVVEASFPTNAPACMIGYTRSWNCPDIPDSAIVEVDNTVSLDRLYTDMNFRMSEINSNHYMVARLNQNGPILANTKLNGFWVQAATDSYMWLVANNGESQTWENQLVAEDVPQDVNICISIIVSGVTLDDGTLERTITSTNLTALGEYDFFMIRPDSLNTSTCHTIKTYENGIYIGEAYYSGNMPQE